MKVLIICSGNYKNFIFSIHQAFVYDQIEFVKRNYNIEYDTFFITEKGIVGYLKSIFKLKKKINTFKPDLLHAHFGLSGLVSIFNFKVPVIVTFHGSDGNEWFLRLISRFVSYFSAHSIFVSEKIKKIINISTKKGSIVPCGINLDDFYPINKFEARKKLKMNMDENFILFASSFSVPVKNYSLAVEAIDYSKNKYTLIELVNKSREEVLYLLNACDLLLMTSINEGSPQIIKEAMACNCPIVSTDVGDVKDIINDYDGCYITRFSIEDIAEKIDDALNFSKQKIKLSPRPRNGILIFDNNIISKKIYKIYNNCIKS